MKKKKLILLIDDDNICNTLNKFLIRKTFDHEVEICAFLNAADAIIFLRDSFSESLYEKIIVLLDLNMPIMDGWEFIDEYRSLHEKECSVNVYILSSSLHSADHERAKKDPIVKEFISKPISAHFLKKLHTWMV